VAKTAEPKPATGAAAEAALSFEQILEKLEAVVDSLEQGDRPLEEALSTFERGVALARAGAHRLDEAERRIEVLLGDEDAVRTRPLGPADSSPADLNPAGPNKELASDE
jgi:exodeoxyribonuclease VII small subunit